MNESENQAPLYTVRADGERAIVRVSGRASYLNCAAVGKLFPSLLSKGKRHIIVDLEHCSGMDSTFLGILAGAALQGRRQDPPVAFTLANPGERNLELARNLGLHRILSIIKTKPLEGNAEQYETLAEAGPASAGDMLAAHRSLVEADQSNQDRFQDVIQFLNQESTG